MHGFLTNLNVYFARLFCTVMINNITKTFLINFYWDSVDHVKYLKEVITDITCFFYD